MVFLRLNLQMVILRWEDFDDAIVEYLAAEFKKDNGIDLKTDKLALQRLKEQLKKLKLNFHQLLKQK